MDQSIINSGHKLPSNTETCCWVFDLDNTLYPAQYNIFSQIDEKMGTFISNLLRVDRKEARAIQKDYFVRYGTTLRGLIDVYGVNPEEFLNFVHDIDLTSLYEDFKLRDKLKKLKGRKIVFTNGDISYAERVLGKIGILNQFEGVFDISTAGYVPKPNAETYKSFVDHFNLKPEKTVMIEDMARNLVPAAMMGMTTVWLKTGYKWSDVGYSDIHIHHETDHLVSWLDQCIKVSE